jgi:hypothetical protein
MPAPRVYADFNAIEYLASDRSAALLNLTGYGTLASLSLQKLRLTEGLSLVLYEPDDIEADATVHFDESRLDPIGRSGSWVARLDARKIRSCVGGETLGREHPCFGCGKDLSDHFLSVGRYYDESCPQCGASVMAPLSRPDAT